MANINLFYRLNRGQCVIFAYGYANKRGVSGVAAHNNKRQVSYAILPHPFRTAV